MIDGPTLFRHAIASPDVMRYVRKSFAKLDRMPYDRIEALRLLSQNTRDAARSYTKRYARGEDWQDVAPFTVRDACGKLLLAMWRGTLTVHSDTTE